MKKPVILAILFVFVVIGMVVYSTLGSRRYRCEVCITLNGKSACRSAAAGTEEQALRAARDMACAEIASGVTESMQCGQTAPDRVRWLAGK